MNLLVTRPLEDQEQTLSALKELGLTGLSAPVMVVKRVAGSLPVQPWQGVIVTSRNSLRLLSEQELAPLKGLALFCVGRKTADFARGIGFDNVKHVQGRIAGLADVILHSCQPQARPFLYLSGVHRTGFLEAELAASGFVCHLEAVYETCAVEHFSAEVKDAVQQGFIDGVLLYSARTTEIFMDLIDRDGLRDFAKGLRYYCLSQAVADPIAARGYSFVVAQSPNERSLLASAQNDHNYLR
ncbi:MAG: uroporphyrinogen-III synthase [Cohaesibacter sp.]|nr:uroporphyrinogen-III synthase [Cohaesibacter sp.]MCV6601618.1 uroporphyrinogen-III synthase [Cohaesibacter sp.]